VTLSWSAVRYAVGYNVYRSTSKAGTYTKLNDVPIRETSYTDGRSGSAGTTFWYKITSVGYGLETLRSEPISRVSRCQRPANLKASANQQDGTVTLSWSAPTVKGSVSGYRIYQWNASKEAFEWIGGSLKADGTATKITIPAKYITRGETGQYSIRAFNGKDTVNSLSAYAAAAKATVNVLPTAPTGLSTANNLTTGRVKLSWNKVANATGYNIYRATSKNGTYTKLNASPVTTLSYTDGRSGSAGTTFWYRVTAIRNGAESVKCDAVSRVSMCQRPAGLKATANADGSVSLSWNAPAVSGSVSGYRVYLWDTAKKSFQWINGSLKASGTATSVKIPASALSAYKGKTVNFSIRGFNSKNTVSSISIYAQAAAVKTK